MPGDGPPWTVGQNCTVTMRHLAVNGNVATGLYVKPDSYRMSFPKVYYPGAAAKAGGVASPLAAGKVLFEFVVVSRAGVIHQDGTPTQRTAAQWHTDVLAYAGQVGTVVTFGDPSGASWSVFFDEVEDRLSPLSGRWLLEWETRCVLVQQ